MWQTDFSQFETAGGGTWRISAVLDYATKVCLAATVVATTAARDAIECLRTALDEAEALLGRPLRDDCVDLETGELLALTVVSDNGPAYKSLDWLRFISARPELSHVRTRHRAPETNGVVERFFQSLKYEHLYRIEIGDVLELQAEVDAFRQLYNTWRPHETLGQTHRSVTTWPSLPASPTYLSRKVSKKLDSGHRSVGVEPSADSVTRTRLSLAS